jgi:hypothetical protein
LPIFILMLECKGVSMFRSVVRFSLIFLILVGMRLPAQDFKLDGREVQIHGFASQGFIYTDHNNWLTMHTSQGSGAFTDFGANASMQVTDKLRIGAQGFDRNLGNLGEWHPSVDWALVDYRCKSWFGFRAGKVKTALGLYNDTQDFDFLHTFALLPQSIYPADLREAAIAHIGGDVYGTFSLRHNLGDLSYTAYVGHRSDSIYSGYPYFLSQFGIYIHSYGGLQYGADLRWKTPWKRLLIGASRLNEDITGKGTGVSPFNSSAGFQPYYESSRADWTNQFYGQYTAGNLLIDAEYRRYWRNQEVFNDSSADLADVRGWYVAGSYRVSKRLAIGSYYSRYMVTNVTSGLLSLISTQATDTSLPANHDYDKVVTVRVDLNKFWNVKIEGHFIDGYGDAPYPNGFYPQVNPNGFKPNTDALVLQTSVAF